MGIGISSGGGMWITRATMKDYMLKQGKGLLMAPILVPLTMFLNKQVDGLGDMVSLGMVSADLLMTGDPLGLLVYGVGQLWDAAAQSRQKVVDNDTPDQDYGSRVGYVREGDTWYPAIYNQKYKSTGLWAGDQQMTLDYGGDIVWKMDGSGQFVPMIPNAASKNFVVLDAEWEGKKYSNTDTILSGKGFVNRNVFENDPDHKTLHDSTRDWYFLNPEDTKKVMAGELHLESYTDDATKMNPAARLINDWRKALDTSQDWKWSSAVRTMGPAAAINNYAGSRGLQRIMMEATGDRGKGVLISNEEDYATYIYNNATRQGEDFNSGHAVQDMYQDYMFKTVMRDHIQALYRSQRVAARESKFDELYQTSEGAKLEEFADFDETEGGTVWSAMYLDTAKDVPVAGSAEELQQQLHTIETLNDRTPAQRNYLAQKVQTRYWMQQCVQMGQSTELLHMLNGRDWANSDPYDMKRFTGSATSQWYKITRYTGEGPDAIHDWDQFAAHKEMYDKYGVGNPDITTVEGEILDPGMDVVGGQHLDAVPGFAMPWQNAGEGWLHVVRATRRQRH